MLKDKIDKIEFKNPKEPIDVFFSGNYPYKDKGYYLRGQILELRDNIHYVNGKLLEQSIDICYHFLVLVLLNDKYLKSYKNKWKNIPWGIFYGRWAMWIEPCI